jgi:multicomponent Na+:H+ antiporter subunit E
LLGFGVASCVLVVLIARGMGIHDEEGVPVHLSLRLLLYIPWLTWAIVKANVDVALRILSPGLPIAPRMVHVRPGQKSDLGRVIYANSITLTPGTVTCDADGDGFVVHALTKEAADDLESGAMDQRVTRLEGAKAG